MDNVQCMVCNANIHYSIYSGEMCMECFYALWNKFDTVNNIEHDDVINTFLILFNRTTIELAYKYILNEAKRLGLI